MRFTFLLIALILFDILVISSVLTGVPDKTGTPQLPVALHETDTDPGTLLPAAASGVTESADCVEMTKGSCSQKRQDKPAE